MDHGILSPSGKVSKKYEKQAKERTRKELFGDGLAFPTCQQPTEKESLLRRANEFQRLSKLGMCSKKYTKLAKELREKAATIAS